MTLRISYRTHIFDTFGHRLAVGGLVGIFYVSREGKVEERWRLVFPDWTGRRTNVERPYFPDQLPKWLAVNSFRGEDDPMVEAARVAFDFALERQRLKKEMT